MEQSLTPAAISAFTALAAVLISPLISVYVVRRQIEATAEQQRKQIRAELVSANRQAWINQLREATAQALAITWNLTAPKDEDYPIRPEEKRAKAEELVGLNFKIQLMVNPEEADSFELVKRLTLAHLSAWEGETTGKDWANQSKAVVQQCQRVLKSEWERVKAGD